MSIPKVLIFGQPFNNKYGGGITLTNLFRGWDKDRIAVAVSGHVMYGATTDVCDTYYQLGKEEFKWRFPFNLVQRKFPSGIKSFGDKSEIPSNQNETGLRYALVNQFFYPALEWLGLSHCVSKIKMSSDFKKWLSEYKPDVLYLQLSTREAILFASDLIDYLKVPSAFHIMDDWPSTISMYGLFKKYWKTKIDKEIRVLLNKVDVHLSISDAMSDEYEVRYNIKFIPFHNPIETNVWLPLCKANFTLNKSYITILYSGRIGTTGVSDSLLDIASAIDSININDFNIKLHIQTTMQEHNILQLLQRFNCVVINPVADYDEIPDIFSKADFLLLANDFSAKAIKFLRLSMPTKASEYMISGTPVLVYAPKETAVSRFFSQNDCGYCLTSQSQGEIIKAIQFLISNEEYRKRISRNAVNLAKEKFDAEKVRKKFKETLTGLTYTKGQADIFIGLNGN
jgi:glycosyltransferase involved in cell wall biosynthesis